MDNDTIFFCVYGAITFVGAFLGAIAAIKVHEGSGAHRRTKERAERRRAAAARKMVSKVLKANGHSEHNGPMVFPVGAAQQQPQQVPWHVDPLEETRKK